MRYLRKISIGGLEIDNLSLRETVDLIEKAINKKNLSRPFYIFNPNLHCLYLMNSNSEFSKAYRRGNLIVPDGVFILRLASFLKTPFKERVNGTDLTDKLIKKAVKKGYRIFFLTARTGLGQSLFSQLKNKELKASYFDWPYKKYHDNKYSKKALKEINNCSPDILFLGLGASWQEIWAIRNKSKLKAKLVIAVGSALDYVSGQKKRAPLWMQKNGLEWFWRFLIEPKRLFKRFFIEDFPLALKLIAKG